MRRTVSPPLDNRAVQPLSSTVLDCLGFFNRLGYTASDQVNEKAAKGAGLGGDHSIQSPNLVALPIPADLSRPYHPAKGVFSPRAKVFIWTYLSWRGNGKLKGVLPSDGTRVSELYRV